MRFNIKFALFFLVFLSLKVEAQYTPFFQNFSLSEYNAGNQNWGVSRADNGKLYVANNNGLLEYDGLKWNFIQLPNKTTIRSVLAYKGLIYTGSYEEFGYWKENSKGVLVYTSLINLVKENISPNEEIWQILPYKDGIVFRSFQNIYLYKFKGNITKIEPQSTVLSCSVVDGRLYVATLNNGIFELQNNTLMLKIMDKALENTKVLSITNYKGKLLLATSLKGCYVVENNKTVTPLQFEINTLIKQHLLNCFSVLNNGNMVFGTIKDGVYVTDSNGKVIFHINKENGLINNTVLSQCLDKENKLWLGLDNGIAFVDLNGHNYFYKDVSGRLGAVYDVIKFNNVIYLGSNTGLFYLDKDNKLQFIKGSQGQVWYLKEIDGDLFCGHNEGTFLVKDYKLNLISPVTGGWDIKKVPDLSDTYIQSTYAGLVRFTKENNSWDAKYLEGTTMPIRSLVFQDKNTAWAAHAYKGLYKIKFNDTCDSIVNISDYVKKGIKSDYNVRVYKIKNDICLKTNNEWLKYDPFTDSIIPHKFLNDNLGKDSYIISEDNMDILAFKNSQDIITFKSFTNENKNFSLLRNFFANRLIVGNERISKISDSTYALNLNDGFMIIDARFKPKSKLLSPIIESIQVDDKLIDINKDVAIVIHLNNRVAISVASPKSSNHFFEYAIAEQDSTKWTQLDKNKLELANLKDGMYSVLFRTNNNFEVPSPSTKIKLKVLPPWYKDTLGFVLYSSLAILILVLVYIFNQRKTKREQRLLKIKYAKEQQEILRQKTLDNEKRIVQLKNEALQNEVKLKSKQLANTAMALVKKNETLQDIKKELSINKSSFDNQYSFKKILKKVDSSIAHKDEWKVFEYNFNQVHEDFFKILKGKHPILTSKDLRVCAYIKMNLSNKEIAPLMNVSVRGLETHRYRLKKKLNLESDISVVDYLMNLE
ncbi:helix-turn-helix and ligand-binding sensor domain-containing protein [Yeosuana marina]|uniref:helix-turn-helix and ligand-binding sensor domain-containing protein n=1 Tax=Yeosuana marina TaxID=1565536 RepID=UPI0030C83600